MQRSLRVGTAAARWPDVQTPVPRPLSQAPAEAWPSLYGTISQVPIGREEGGCHMQLSAVQSVGLTRPAAAGRGGVDSGTHGPARHSSRLWMALMEVILPPSPRGSHLWFVSCRKSPT